MNKRHWLILIVRRHGYGFGRSAWSCNLLRMDNSPQRFASAEKAQKYVETMEHSRIATALYPNEHLLRVLEETDRIYAIRDDNIPLLSRWTGYDPAGSPSYDPNVWRRCRRVCGRDVPGYLTNFRAKQ